MCACAVYVSINYKCVDSWAAKCMCGVTQSVSRCECVNNIQ